MSRILAGALMGLLAALLVWVLLAVVGFWGMLGEAGSFFGGVALGMICTQAGIIVFSD